MAKRSQLNDKGGGRDSMSLVNDWRKKVARVEEMRFRGDVVGGGYADRARKGKGNLWGKLDSWGTRVWGSEGEENIRGLRAVRPRKATMR